MGLPSAAAGSNAALLIELKYIQDLRKLSKKYEISLANGKANGPWISAESALEEMATTLKVRLIDIEIRGGKDLKDGSLGFESKNDTRKGKSYGPGLWREKKPDK